ncbi:MAG: acyl carrier protein [Desulfobacula sp.]|nr:acyl carrier protein [Desulfobacula sp.]
MQNLKEKIKQFILSTFPLARKKNINYDDPLLETGIIDSLGILEIVNYLIEELGVNIEEDDLTPENFNTILDIIRFIENKETPVN